MCYVVVTLHQRIAAYTHLMYPVIVSKFILFYRQLYWSIRVPHWKYGFIMYILHLNASCMNYDKHFLTKSTFTCLTPLMSAGKQNFPPLMQDYYLVWTSWTLQAMDGFSVLLSAGMLSVWEISQYGVDALGRDDTLQSSPFCAALLRLPQLHTANSLNWGKKKA